MSFNKRWILGEFDFIFLDGIIFFIRFYLSRSRITNYYDILSLETKGPFGLMEIKWKKIKLQKSMNKLGLTLIKVHSLVSVIFLHSILFPSNQTNHKRLKLKS
jgi:hypothetical protein